MLFSGYHTTSLAAAENILKSGEYFLSHKDDDWLADGIYFYFDINDAYEWEPKVPGIKADVILHSIISVENDEYFDLDTEYGRYVYRELLEFIEDTCEIDISGKTAQQTQCAVMRLLWKTLPKIKVISCSFAKEKTKIKTLVDARIRRKEFCVRSNEYIKCTYLIRKDDLRD